APRQHSTPTREPVFSTSAPQEARQQTISSQAWRWRGSSQVARHTTIILMRWVAPGLSQMLTDTLCSRLATSHTARIMEHPPEARCSSLQVHLTVLQLVCTMIISGGTIQPQDDS